jgi:hypothetical protein
VLLACELVRSKLEDETRVGWKVGRNHHVEGFALWIAGDGIKALHLLGLDHTKLTFKFQGRDFRLTDVSGRAIEKMLSLAEPI